MRRPADLSDAEYATFMRYVMQFFIAAEKLWWKDSQGEHKLVVDSASRVAILSGAHDDVAHKGFYATNTLISQ